ncbi:MAG: hypothetical protein IJ598_13710 [Ruminococcus sp.]|nr:hypothetical protein [Ruminococcus sp.]
MILYLKRDISANAGFVVFDALSAEKYRVAMPVSGLMPRRKLVVTDTAGRQAASIRRLSLAGASVYVIRVGKKHLTLVMLPSAQGMITYFYGCNWRFVGAVAAKQFSIIDVDKTLILEHRERADYCELQIPNSSNELVCVAVSVCVNLINTIDSPALQAV